PETKFGDTAVAVHPDDKRYQKYIDKEIEIETVLGKAKIKVIADDFVDMEFGTGVVKITPAHDFDDNEVASRHNLPLKQVIGFDGKMNEKAGKFEGLYVKQARKAVVEEMQNKGLLEKVDENYTHRIGLCYKCKNPIEPLPLEQWFVKTGELAKPAISAVKKGLPAGRQGKIKIYPKNFEKIYFDFLENIRDWNISRQIVWGIRVPAYKCRNPKSEMPFATLQTNKEGDFKTFYPTSVMETGYDILRWWVARMVMLGIYETGKIPFVNILLHGLVNDPLGKKMSKSKGNAVNPLELVDQYGADAVRFALVYGTATGNDQSLSYPKLQSMRNFTNKLWNIGRFLQLQLDSGLFKDIKPAEGKREPEKYKEMVESVDNLSKKVSESLDQYRFHDAANELYEFIWHVFADKYIEELKEPLKDGEIEALAAFIYVWETSLKLLHPFMPFITEELWRKIPEAEGDLIVSKWPSFAKASEGKPL
ncbi:MAG: Valine-tRNA ligase, partial [Candidatus Levybacteria bacterium GW2011_GWC1_40_19]